MREEIGTLIRNLRKSKGLSQMQLAEMIGVSYQQIQKYEKGTDNLSVDRLRQFAKALETPVTTFFPSGEALAAESVPDYGRMPDDERRLLELYRGLKSKKLKSAVFELLKVLAAQ
jgi:transcriptional regulator with XRE-family HTH domain